MNLSSKWLGVLKNGMGWGGGNLGELCTGATTTVAPTPLPAYFKLWAETFLSLEFALMYPENALEIPGKKSRPLHSTLVETLLVSHGLFGSDLDPPEGLVECGHGRCPGPASEGPQGPSKWQVGG